ncbi:hypothetical protein HCCG_00667 [Helicobacter cinaedi CCUG 18818 = ATCC BAA-847]|uniref:Uncharacterized protein n=1 Tax=Helicobacter cinaedi CCUG 18818 = ATCC BAA-847 TaxID=537971 RepID=A0ABN0B9F9_9HELI|nr:hypothetical protein HCCG_00667 [Helicobacter cinaedi CCUG 18818 = ATCC BAA-847]
MHTLCATINSMDSVSAESQVDSKTIAVARHDFAT